MLGRPNKTMTNSTCNTGQTTNTFQSWPTWPTKLGWLLYWVSPVPASFLTSHGPNHDLVRVYGLCWCVCVCAWLFRGCSACFHRQPWCKTDDMFLPRKSGSRANCTVTALAFHSFGCLELARCGPSCIQCIFLGSARS